MQVSESISLVDLSFYPYLEQFPILAPYRGIEMPDSLPHLHAWMKAMRNRQSVQSNMRDAAFYIAEYKPFVA